MAGFFPRSSPPSGNDTTYPAVAWLGFLLSSTRYRRGASVTCHSIARTEFGVHAMAHDAETPKTLAREKPRALRKKSKINTSFFPRSRVVVANLNEQHRWLRWLFRLGARHGRATTAAAPSCFCRGCHAWRRRRLLFNQLARRRDKPRLASAVARNQRSRTKRCRQCRAHHFLWSGRFHYLKNGGLRFIFRLFIPIGLVKDLP